MSQVPTRARWTQGHSIDLSLGSELMTYWLQSDTPPSHHGNPLLTYVSLQMELDSAVRLPAEMGLSGAVLWGSSDVMRAKNECTILQQYINTTLGPYVQNVTTFFHACYSQLCNGHGRCVNKAYERYYQHYLKKTRRTQCQIPHKYLSTKNRKTLNSFTWNTHLSRGSELFQQAGDYPKYNQPSSKDGSSLRVEPENDYDNYVCKCLPGWSGTYCEKSLYGQSLS